MIITKNQIRTRRLQFRFSNAEILLFNTVVTTRLLPPSALGSPIAIRWIDARANIVQPYTNIDVAAFLFFRDDFSFKGSGSIENNAANGIAAFTDLFSPIGLNLISYPSPQQDNDSSNFVVPNDASNWADLADIHINGGVTMQFSNGGSGDLTGGDPANFLDIFLEYSLVNL